MAFPFDQINAVVNFVTAPVRAAAQSVQTGTVSPEQITGAAQFALGIVTNPVVAISQALAQPAAQAVQRVVTPPPAATPTPLPKPFISTPTSYATVTYRSMAQPTPTPTPQPEPQPQPQPTPQPQQELPQLPVATGDIDHDAAMMCNADLPLATRNNASYAVDSWLERVFDIRGKLSLWKSQGYDTSSVETLLSGHNGWKDSLARASSNPEGVGAVCNAWSGLLDAIKNMSGTAAPSGVDQSQVEKIFARGIGIIMPNYVIEGSKTNLKAFITRNISQEPGVGEPIVTIVAGGQKLAEVQTVNRTADITIDIPVGAKYYKVCASSSVGGQDCKTVKVMKEVPNIGDLVAAENNLLEALKSAIGSRNIIAATPITSFTTAEIPEIQLPKIPSGATIDIPTITLPAKATEPIQIYVDGKPYGSPPLSISMPAGKHIVTASLKGFSDINKTIRVAEGAKVVIPEIAFG
jgi:hypothetical protein